MKFEAHCAESVILFGKPFAEVHRWLDEFAGQPPCGMRHRSVRHHAAGIRQAAALWGTEAAAAARQHIISDLKMQGWIETDPFPEDEADYVRLGYF